jgi:hypothetical protein
MRFLKIFLPILALDLICLWFWVKGMGQEPGTSMVVVTIVPIILSINLAIAGILYLLKKSEYSKYFILNALIASAIFYAFFVSSVRKFNSENFDVWSFKRADTTFIITQEVKNDFFFITYKPEEGSPASFVSGKCEKSSEGVLLSTDSLKMEIRNNVLIGFPGNQKPIDLTKSPD